MLKAGIFEKSRSDIYLRANFNEINDA